MSFSCPIDFKCLCSLSHHFCVLDVLSLRFLIAVGEVYDFTAKNACVVFVLRSLVSQDLDFGQKQNSQTYDDCKRSQNQTGNAFEPKTY